MPSTTQTLALNNLKTEQEDVATEGRAGYRVLAATRSQGHAPNLLISMPVKEPVFRVEKRPRIKPFNCEHTDRRIYSRGMCSRCYAKHGRIKKASLCQHTDRRMFCRKMCKACFLKYQRYRELPPDYPTALLSKVRKPYMSKNPYRKETPSQDGNGSASGLGASMKQEM